MVDLRHMLEQLDDGFEHLAIHFWFDVVVILLVQLFRRDVDFDTRAETSIHLHEDEMVHRMSLCHRLFELDEDGHLVAVNPRKLEQLHDVLVHDLVIVRTTMELDIVAVEVETVLSSWHKERYVWEAGYYIAWCVAKASLLQNLLVEDLGGRDLVIWVLCRRVVILLFYVFDLSIAISISVCLTFLL